MGWFIDKYLEQGTWVYLFLLGIIHLSYFIAFFGIFVVNPEYIHALNVFVQIFVVVFLLLRFHPFRNHYAVKRGDQTIIFGSAFLLGTNLISVEFAKWIPLPNIPPTIDAWRNAIPPVL